MKFGNGCISRSEITDVEVCSQTDIIRDPQLQVGDNR